MNLRSISLTGVKGTKVVWSAVCVVVVAQLAISYIPVLQTVFGTQSPTLIDNLVIVLTGLALLLLLEIEKVVRLTLYQRKH
jgi:hypothetical protein